MKLSESDPDHAHYVVKDCNGNTISCIQEFDTETKEITLYLVNCSGDSRIVCDPKGPVTVKLILEGSYAEDKNGRKL